MLVSLNSGRRRKKWAIGLRYEPLLRLTIEPGAVKRLEGSPRMLRRETLDVDAALWRESRSSVTSVRRREVAHRTSVCVCVCVCGVGVPLASSCPPRCGRCRRCRCTSPGWPRGWPGPSSPRPPWRFKRRRRFTRRKKRKSHPTAHPAGSRGRYSHDRVKHVSDLQTRSQAVGRRVPPVQREGWGGDGEQTVQWVCVNRWERITGGLEMLII